MRYFPPDKPKVWGVVVRIGTAFKKLREEREREEMSINHKAIMPAQDLISDGHTGMSSNQDQRTVKDGLT